MSDQNAGGILLAVLDELRAWDTRRRRSNNDIVSGGSINLSYELVFEV